MKPTKKTNKVKNKSNVKKKTTAKKKVSPYLVFKKPVNLIPAIDRDFSKTLGYFELCYGEGRIIQKAIKYYLDGLGTIGNSKNKDLIVDRSKSLLNIFKNAIKK